MTRARGCHEDSEHWLDYVYILRVETVRFLKDQIWYGREREKSRMILKFLYGLLVNDNFTQAQNHRKP